MTLLLVLGLILAAFAATAETSLTSVSSLRIRTLCEEGNKRAERVARLHANPNAYLSTILTINTVAVIVASTSATVLTVNSTKFPEAVVTAALAVFVLIFCEIAPKSFALRYSEAVALRLARPVAWLTTVLRPVVGGLTLISTIALRLGTRGKVRGPFVTEDELRMLLAVSEQEGVVEEDERQMIHGILEMTDKAVREVMVPRVGVMAVEADRPSSELIRVVIEHGYSRIPIYDDNVDNIIGVVYAKDLLRHGVRSDQKVSLRALAREPYFTPEAKHVGELLREMRERKVHIAIVVDEHGGTAGIVTLEDLIEEIVGPIRDEYDISEPEDVTFISDHEVLMSARVSIDDVRELLHLDIDEVDADFIGGLVYAKLGEIPKAGATIDIDGAKLTVETVRRQAIQQVRITSPTPFARDRNSANHEGDDQGGAQTAVS